MVVVANKSIFGGGPYSVAGATQLRMVGQRKWPSCDITIERHKPGGKRDPRTGIFKPPHTAPFLPKRIRDPYHPSGNSLCFMIQTAHLMGCSPIYCLGFTLATGTGYFFGSDNPVTRKRAIYDAERALEWLRWYRSQHPGRALLWPGWVGPVYDALEVLDAQEARRLTEAKPPFGGRQQPDQDRRDAASVERLRQGPRQDQPIHADGGQPVSQREGPVIRERPDAARKRIYRRRPS